jgi:hypothetical protein
MGTHHSFRNGQRGDWETSPEWMKATIATHIIGAYGCPRSTRQRWINWAGSAFGASTVKYDEGNPGLCKP